MSAGCESGGLNASLDSAVKKLFSPKLSPQQYMLIAVSDADPDARRDAIARVSDSKKYDEEWAIKGFRTIALLEKDTQTRCVAIRALGRSGDPRAVEACLMILDYLNHPTEVEPPNETCRWDATVSLANQCERGDVSEDQRAAVRDALIMRLRGDMDRHVREAAARGLANFKDGETVEALIGGLRDEDFAVAHRCEMSLVALTGETHDCDPYAWDEWFAAHKQDAFAKSGYVPESRRPPYNGPISRSWYKTKQVFEFLWPGAKE